MILGKEAQEIYKRGLPRRLLRKICHASGMILILAKTNRTIIALVHTVHVSRINSTDTNSELIYAIV
jgi:hypothetical protein